MNLSKCRLLSATLASGVLLVSGLSGCGSGNATVTANLKLTSNAVTARQITHMMDSLLIAPDPSRVVGVYAGAATAAQLTSMKYFIEQISICQDMTTTGTAWNNPTGCITVYSGPADGTLNPAGGAGASPDYAALSTYAAGVTSGYIDLMDATSRAAIGASATAITAGSYKWGYINWAYPIKVTASMDTGGTTIYTRSGTYANVGGNGVTTASSAFTTSGAQEAIVSLPNGGTWFKFQNPFVVTDSDTSLAVDLTFNPDSLIRGFRNNGGATPSNLSYYDGANDGSHNAINVPFLDLTPVPRHTGESTIVETYTAAHAGISGTTDTFSLRLELYYNSADTAKSIYGATLRVIPASDTQYATDVAKIAFVTAGTGSTINFNDYGNNPIISGFTRQSSVAGTTTATLPCTGAYSTTTFSPTGCSSGSSLTATFQLSSVKILN